MAFVRALCCDRASLSVLDDLVDPRDFLPIVDGLHHTGCPEALVHRLSRGLLVCQRHHFYKVDWYQETFKKHLPI